MSSMEPLSKDLTRVHNLIRVEQGLNPPHQFNFFKRSRVVQKFLFGQADAVLGADGAAEGSDLFVENVVRALAAFYKIFEREVLGFEDINMDVSVADVAEPNDFEIRVGKRKDLLRFFNEFWGF